MAVTSVVIENGRHAAVRAGAVLLAGCLVAGVLGGCAYSQRAKVAAPSTPALSEIEARSFVDQWCARVGEFVAGEDRADPAALSRLPALRSQAVPRPGRIVFSVFDLSSSAAERDGYDVSGLLVGKKRGESGTKYVFVVGAVERSNYRPVGLADIRIAAMSIRDGSVTWDVGYGNSASLERYREHADASAAARFPADRDRFRLLDCQGAICVEEIVSGARWALPVETTAAPPAGVKPAG